ncbi:quinone oxidoreductase [Neoehrlichia mikurensis]|uniref:Quinone oxidoreductase n=1 Tax=Neoehrlichia mikurensis TaxID=89586 RepID=A0A9Q9F3P7_9RICK|nr:quinone oxidoreductase [Neoehrlichia mikurensis]QXK91776.1 quinone oxidoreductase [Neoehrlichia mikurensis]QXK92989.1 quinone oxidoreductase [Neoehrlichia mikurensis]QXK93466.1 quinone oxidoreductase [Neoehrlichia mikurensis]UTO55580.1 quinone oxidoreductase [Neoehrlichia mikurensis]UTO56501.1 quinone oxidoreductase [Neoehrlichia mikurensis]
MVKAIIINNTGDYDVLKYTDVNVKDPGNCEVLIRHTAIGLNRYDVEHRSGIRKSKSLPNILGVEAVGVVEKVGSATEALSVGDRVGYCTAYGGAYSEVRVINQKYLFKIHDSITDEVAAAVLLKSMTAHYLIHRVYDVRPKTFALVYGLTGGISQILCQWAAYKGCQVIGAVSSNNHIDIARRYGCSYVVNYHDDDFVHEIMDITKGVGANVVYDPIGLVTYKKAFESLCVFGLYVSYGQISGPISNISMSMLNSRSLFVSSPTIHHYKRSRLELGLSAIEIFEMIKRGYIKVNVNRMYKFSEVKKAHKDLESRKLTGSNVIVF